MTVVCLENIYGGPGGASILNGINISFGSGLTGLVGPNGAGKTTLLRMIMGLLAPTTGAVYVNDISLVELTLRDRARRITYLPQNGPVHWAMQVRDLVRLGRYASASSVAEDEAAVENTMQACAVDRLASRTINTLSGGERSRVLLARALCAQTPVVLVDEPSNALDPAQQHRIMGILHARAQAGTSVLCALHDLPLAARYCDRLVFLNEGIIGEDGAPGKVLTAKSFTAAYGLAFDKRGYLVDDK